MSDVEVRRYAVARSALTNPALSRAPMRTGLGIDAHVLNMEGADHARHRKAVEVALGKAVEDQLPRVIAAIDGIVKELPDGVPVDAGAHLAYPIAVAVVDLVVGLGGPDTWAYWVGVARAIDADRVAPGQLREAAERLAARNGLGLAGLAREEVAANLLFATSAGITNMTNAIGAAVQALASHPHEYARLHADPAALLTSATDELLRYAEPPMRSSTRQTVRPTEVGGERVGAGRTIRIFKAEANRDPERFAEPDRLDLSRKPNAHLSFGHGPHYCPAAHLSRMVLDRVLLGLAARFAAIEGDAGAWDVYDGRPLMVVFRTGESCSEPARS